MSKSIRCKLVIHTIKVNWPSVTSAIRDGRVQQSSTIIFVRTDRLLQLLHDADRISNTSYWFEDLDYRQCSSGGCDTMIEIGTHSSVPEFLKLLFNQIDQK